MIPRWPTVIFILKEKWISSMVLWAIYLAAGLCLTVFLTGACTCSVCWYYGKIAFLYCGYTVFPSASQTIPRPMGGGNQINYFKVYLQETHQIPSRPKIVLLILLCNTLIHLPAFRKCIFFFKYCFWKLNVSGYIILGK